MVGSSGSDSSSRPTPQSLMGVMTDLQGLIGPQPDGDPGRGRLPVGEEELTMFGGHYVGSWVKLVEQTCLQEGPRCKLALVLAVECAAAGVDQVLQAAWAFDRLGEVWNQQGEKLVGR